MSGYEPPTPRDAFRVYAKFCRMLVEPTLIAVVLLFLEAEWWWFVGLLVLWLPLARIKLQELRDEWSR